MKKIKNPNKTKGPFIFKCGNGRKRRFRTQELFSEAWIRISTGRFKNSAQIWEVISRMPNGFN